MADLHLIVYLYSVYTRIVRMALLELRLDATYTEADPFAEPPDARLAALTPFGRVPVLREGGFVLTETAAILRYLDDLSAMPSLVPTDPHARARMAQIIGITDAYGYIPMVRQVFSHSVFRPQFGDPADPAKITTGLQNAVSVLSALDSIAQEGLQPTGQHISLADIHLAPMIAYFDMAPEWRACLGRYPALDSWCRAISTRPSLTVADPFPVIPT